jgi:hypothetical protein
MYRVRLLTAAGLLAAVGCGDDGPRLAPVHGTVTLDGKPLAGKTVKFVPDPGTPGQGAGATTDAEGTYTLIAARPGATRDTPGAPAGAYRVVVEERMFPDALPPARAATDGAPAPAVGPPVPNKKKKQEIPPAYGSADTTPLRVTVPDGGGVMNLAMESGAKK